MVYNRASPPLTDVCKVYRECSPEPDRELDELRFWPLMEFARVHKLEADKTAAEMLAKKIADAAPKDRKELVSKLEEILKRLLEQKKIHCPEDISTK